MSSTAGFFFACAGAVAFDQAVEGGVYRAAFAGTGGGVLVINLDRDGVVALKNAVSGHCGVCGEHGLHDHFDCQLRELVCLTDVPFLLEAEKLAPLLSHAAGPLAAEDVDLVAKLFSRGRSVLE